MLPAVGAMLFAAKGTVSYCTPSLRSASGYILEQAEAPAALLIPPPRVDPGKPVLVVIVSSVAAVAAIVTAAAMIALVMILRGRQHRLGGREEANPRLEVGN